MEQMEQKKTEEQSVESTKNNHKILKIFILVFIGILFFMTCILLYSRYIATKGIIVKEYKITNSKIPMSMHGLKIVHISDIHYGRITKKKELKNLVDNINQVKPDIVILSGDLIDKDTKITGEMVDILGSVLKEIKVTVGKYAIKGNHDYGFQEWNTILGTSDFKDLNDTFDTIYKESNDYLLLSGVSTNLHGEKSIDEKLESTRQYLDMITEEQKKPNYKILVLHEPDAIDQINIDDFDLILAGHSHNGQVRLPFIGPLFLPKGSKKYYEPYYKIKQTELYISSGIGTSSFNFRLWNRPSFNLYRLTNY